jgi:chromosome segregation ATPase
MKFAIILFLIYSAACLDPKYNKYLENIDFTKEPIKSEWMSEGVEGYEFCGYNGGVSIWPESVSDKDPYRFVVWDGKISSPNTIKSSNIKSFKIPKGYKIIFSGMFSMEKMGPFTEEQKSLIQTLGLVDKTKGLRVETIADLICSFDQSYWYANLLVYANHYAKVTRLIPDFLGFSIATQNLSIEKGTHKKKIKECTEQRENDSRSVFDVNNSLGILQQSISEIRTKKIIIDEKVEIYSRLVNDQSYANRWIQNEKNKNNARNAELQIEIDNYLVKINNIFCHKDLWKEKINQDNNIINKSKDNIRSLKEDIDRRTIDLSKQQVKLNNYGQIYTSLVNSLYKTNEKNKNIRSEMLSIDEQIKNLQSLLSAKTTELYQSQLLEKELQKKVYTAKKTIDDMNKIFMENQKSKDYLNTIIAKEELKINRASENTIIIQQNIEISTRKMQEVEDKINEIKIKIEENNEEIKIHSVENYMRQLKILEDEQVKYLHQLTKLSSEFTQLQTRQSALNNNVSKAENCISSSKVALTESSSKYEESYKLVKGKYNEMISIIDNPKTYLDKVITSFDEETHINIWLKTAKTNLFEYIEILPGDVELVMDLVRKRRRMRRMKRRFF